MAATTKTFLNNNPPSVEDDDLNGFKLENSNLIVGIGLVLDGTDHQQTHRAVAHYAAGGDFYTDSGAADAYVLDTIGAQVAPPAYFTGMRIRFVPGNANTGASTVNVDALGVKNLTIDGTAALTVNVLQANSPAEFVYTGTNFQLANASSVFSGFRGVTAVTTTATSITTPVDMIWESAPIDTDAAADIAGANPERITIPAGVTKAKFGMSGKITGTGVVIRLHKNGAVFTGGMYGGQTGISTHEGNTSAWISVVAGDYFTVYVSAGSGVQVQADSWFTAEFK